MRSQRPAMQRRSARRASARKPAPMISLRPLAWSAVAILALARVAIAGDATDRRPAADAAAAPRRSRRAETAGAGQVGRRRRASKARRQGRQCRRRPAGDHAGGSGPARRRLSRLGADDDRRLRPDRPRRPTLGRPALRRPAGTDAVPLRCRRRGWRSSPTAAASPCATRSSTPRTSISSPRRR